MTGSKADRRAKEARDDGFNADRRAKGARDDEIKGRSPYPASRAQAQPL